MKILLYDSQMNESHISLLEFKNLQLDSRVNKKFRWFDIAYPSDQTLQEVYNHLSITEALSVDQSIGERIEIYSDHVLLVLDELKVSVSYFGCISYCLL